MPVAALPSRHTNDMTPYNCDRYFEAIYPESEDIGHGQYDAICQYDGSVYPVECLVDSEGQSIAYTDARMADWSIALDDTCTGEVHHNKKHCFCVELTSVDEFR